MSPFVSPAITAWMSRVSPEFVWAEVLARRVEATIELRHRLDARQEAGRLRLLPAAELLIWSQTDAAGAFRPNRTAPGLRAGWRVLARDPAELETALEGVYPGAVADWHAVVTGAAQPVSFREYTGRQTGMYRCIHHLDDAGAAAVARSGCEVRFCLRRRLWPVGDLPPDGEAVKSVIPCLEPCALMLEFSRQAARAATGGRCELGLDPADRESLGALLDQALHQRDPNIREGDFAAPLNPRRLLRLRQRLDACEPGVRKTSEEG